MTAPDQLDAVVVRSRRDDLVVKAFIVQGGEAEIAGEKAAFARIVMSGVSNLDSDAARRQEIAVLMIDDAAALAAGLHDVLDRIVRSTATPAVATSGSWSWTSTPPLGEDLLVVQASADGTVIAATTGMASTVRVDFTGMPVQGLSAEDPPVQVLGVTFSAPHLAQVLVNSLRKVVRSALQQRRVEVYVSPRAALSGIRI
jgi:hypothetical protein